ncbi:hypothetical protein [Seonamhaeicola maritimus]|uniref:hypothetical protein n=1 Tax=Seonamhaeicola maritimus TaxID=2591822 RepID=UPI0024941EDC|nr:hypothetical protein [Seonamhaeicola maritimus]
MVRIVNYKERLSEDGDAFLVLELQGGIEFVKSQSSNNFYATARKATVTSTFDEATCKALIGAELPGNIIKQECEPYEYVIEDTGEVIELSHRYQYIPEDAPVETQEEEMSNSTIEDFVDVKEAVDEPIFEVELD